VGRGLTAAHYKDPCKTPQPTGFADKTPLFAPPAIC